MGTKMIAGLGNPGSKYKNTRHNAGFIVLDHLANLLRETWKSGKSGTNAEVIEATIAGQKVILIKPMTFMNNSGEAVGPLASYFNIPPEDICVVHDEVDLPFSTVRLKLGGGSGGHNGLKSLDQHLSTNKYNRVRIGVGRSENTQIQTADHVLSVFSKDEQRELEDVLSRAIQGLDAFIEGPDKFRRAMDVLNKKSQSIEKETE